AANAAKDSADIARDSLTKIERAWICIEGFSFHTSPATNTFRYSIITTNKGKSPGYVFETNYTHVAFSAELKAEDFVQVQEIIKHSYATGEHFSISPEQRIVSTTQDMLYPPQLPFLYAVGHIKY